MLLHDTWRNRERSDFVRLPSGSDAAARVAARAPGALAAAATVWIDRVVRKTDRVLLTILFIPVCLYVIDPSQVYPLLIGTKDSLAKTLPFMMVAITIAGAAKAICAETLIARIATRREGHTVALFAVCGALLPFCSCGVIPVIASLLAAGIPLAPVMAFWMSSPLMDPNQFFITASELGWQFAIARATAAIGLGLISGYATMLLMRTRGLSNPLRFKVKINGINKFDPATTTELKWQFWKDRDRSRVFVVHWANTFWFLLRWLTVAFLLERLMIAYIPPTAIASWLAVGGAAEIPIAGAFGALFYVNSFAAIPMVSGLIQLGMSPAAGLTFIVAGGLTSIPAATAVWVLVTRKVFVWHLALAIIGSLLAGYTYAAFLLLS